MILVKNLNKRYKINEGTIKKIAVRILKYIKRPINTELEIIFLSDNAIKSINRRYKKRDRPTDVLSFSLDSLGEIFISLDTALSNSRVYKTEFPEEAVRYVIHGILHLFGYDDESPKARSRMSAKEDRILKSLCEKEDLSRVLTPR